MIYIRGHARDYDQWRQMGLTGWGYADVLPYFKRAENFEGGADAYHGARRAAARLQGRVARTRSTAPSSRPASQAGYRRTNDFNGFQQEGFGPYQLTIKNGQRWSASAAYLHPILGQRPNLTLEIGARTTRILIENGRAVGRRVRPGRPDPRRPAPTPRCCSAPARCSRRTSCSCPASAIRTR